MGVSNTLRGGGKSAGKHVWEKDVTIETERITVTNPTFTVSRVNKTSFTITSDNFDVEYIGINDIAKLSSIKSVFENPNEAQCSVKIKNIASGETTYCEYFYGYVIANGGLADYTPYVSVGDIFSYIGEISYDVPIRHEKQYAINDDPEKYLNDENYKKAIPAQSGLIINEFDKDGIALDVLIHFAKDIKMELFYINQPGYNQYQFKKCKNIEIKAETISSYAFSGGLYAFKGKLKVKANEIKARAFQRVGDKYSDYYVSLKIFISSECLNVYGATSSDAAFSVGSRTKIYCEASSKPDGWETYWKSNGTVIWGVTEAQFDAMPVSA